MKTCEDCIHYHVCDIEAIRAIENIGAKLCHNFKDESRLIELPCSIGDTVYYPYAGKILEKKVTAYHRVYDARTGIQGIDWWYELDNDESETMDADLIGKTVFLTKEEAEKKLEEIKND